jgi:hypothetical protein
VVCARHGLREQNSEGGGAMTKVWDKPCEQNLYHQEHVSCLLRSFNYWTGRSLVEADAPVEQARWLFYAPFVVLSHNTAPDPVLNYANQEGLTLFEFSWEELVTLPSRRTAEPSEQAQRERLLAIVSRQGYIDDYQGVRIAKSGRRFLIEEATVWTLLDQKGDPYGQAATFGRWRFLD